MNPTWATRPSLHRSNTWLYLLLGAFFQFAPCQAPAADLRRSQTIQLHKGWNAVFLEVEPLNTDPGAVFTNMPVDIVASYFPNVTPVQFIRDPNEAPWKEPGWGVWYAPDSKEAIVTDLFAVQGNRAFLIKARQACTWQLQGKIQFKRVRWQPDSFNMVGFPVDPQSPPNMGTFFAGSSAHQGQRIYRLVGDQWTLVTNPGGTALESGVAYWVFCKGGSAYQGPVALKLPFGGDLEFGNINQNLDLQFSNTSPDPVHVTVETVSGTGELPLSYVIRNLATLETTYPRLPSALGLSATNGGATTTFTLQIRREAMTDAEQSTLLKITSDTGSQYWVPAHARRSNLSSNP